MLHRKLFDSRLLAIVAVCYCTQFSWAQPSDLFSELTTQGVVISDAISVKLALASLEDNLSAAERRAVLEKLAGKQEWSRFARDSVMAPVTIDFESIKDSAGNRIGHVIHSAFIVYASLEKLRDKEMMQQIFGKPGDSADTPGVVTEEIPPEQLRKLGISDVRSSGESYAYLELPLLNRVIVRGVIHIETRERPAAYEFIWTLVPNFQSFGKYAARWTKLDRNAVGRIVEGESQPYAGCGGFLGVYEIDKATQQLLVESRMILHEPQAWFAGSNFLRSKLPLAMQENARSLRRKLAK